MFKSSDYTTWTNEAHRFLKEQNVQADTFINPVTVIAEVGRPDKRKRDLDNVFKSIGDFLEDAEILENDHLIHRWDIYWSTEIQNGVQVTIAPMPE